MFASPYIVWFERCSSRDIARVGGKSAGLGEVMRAGVAVPPGFTVTADAYGLFLARNRLDNMIGARLDRVEAHDLHAITEISTELRARLESAPVPPEIEEAVHRSYVDLGAKYGQADVAVAVRSSAVSEDLPDASFAGQYDTLLWVRGAEAVLRSVVRCWSSLFTERALSYRSQKGVPHDQVAMGVAIQKMVRPRVAGAACTLNPANGDRSKIAIDANWGFGEAVASGEVTPDHYIADKVVRQVVKRTVSRKEIEYVVNSASGAITRREIPSERQTIACLSDDEIVRVAQMAQRLEAYYGLPQDAEWAIDADLTPPDNIVILQSRPETVWSRRPRSPVSADRVAGVESVLTTLLRPLRKPSSPDEPQPRE